MLSRLLPKYLEFTLYSAMLETDAAFFAAQLVAMNNATDNASKLIDELTIANEQRSPSRDHQRASGNRRRRGSSRRYECGTDASETKTRYIMAKRHR